jgi:hypothetical protein
MQDNTGFILLVLETGENRCFIYTRHRIYGKLRVVYAPYWPRLDYRSLTGQSNSRTQSYPERSYLWLPLIGQKTQHSTDRSILSHLHFLLSIGSELLENIQCCTCADHSNKFFFSWCIIASRSLNNIIMLSWKLILMDPLKSTVTNYINYVWIHIELQNFKGI